MSDPKPEFVEINGHRLAVYREGSGRPMVMVHGITTYSFIWRRVVPLLSDRFELISYDLLGCGDSDKPLEESYSLKEHAARLRLLVKSLGIDRFHLVGHDLGGGIAQIYSVDEPESLIDLTLINSVASDYWPVQPISALRVPILRQLLMAALDLGTFRMLIKRGVYHQELVTDELMERFRRPLRTSRGRKAFLHFTHDLDNSDLTDISGRLGELDLPVLILRGDADQYLPPSVSEYLHKTIPGSRLERIATAGHYIHEDEPIWIADQLRAFVESHLDSEA